MGISIQPEAETQEGLYAEGQRAAVELGFQGAETENKEQAEITAGDTEEAADSVERTENLTQEAQEATSQGAEEVAGVSEEHASGEAETSDAIADASEATSGNLDDMAEGTARDRETVTGAAGKMERGDMGEPLEAAGAELQTVVEEVEDKSRTRRGNSATSTRQVGEFVNRSGDNQRRLRSH